MHIHRLDMLFPSCVSGMIHPNESESLPFDSKTRFRTFWWALPCCIILGYLLCFDIANYSWQQFMITFSIDPIRCSQIMKQCQCAFLQPSHDWVQCLHCLFSHPTQVCTKVKISVICVYGTNLSRTIEWRLKTAFLVASQDRYFEEMVIERKKCGWKIVWPSPFLLQEKCRFTWGLIFFNTCRSNKIIWWLKIPTLFLLRPMKTPCIR